MNGLLPSRAAQIAPPRAALTSIAMFAVGHILLAVAMRAVPIIATFHAVVCLVAGLTIAARSRIHHVAYAVAYIAGAEVLWRMTRAGVFWEYGKYAVVAVLAVAMVRQRPRRNATLALAYLGLMLPS